MRKFFSILLLLIPAIATNAQIVVDFSSFDRLRNVDVKMTLKDADSKEPVGFASVYLIPQNDTTITAFTLSSDKGEVEIKDVVAGKYQVNVEMLGYKSYKKVHNLKNYMNDLGTIELEEDTEFIDAATITAVGNAISIKKDTIIYNASSFKVGDNDMLEDLLKKMPGMEVDSDGTVKVNGEKVDKITVGGKTFFFNDPSMAVKNLPAKIVDKIKVVDKKKEDAEFTGISTSGDKEKVMDIEFKNEYKEGWFGNAKAGGGVPVKGKDDNEMSGDMKALFNANALVAGYTEKDQLTVIANGKNVDDLSSGMVVIYNDRQDSFTGRKGLSTSAQAGANYNTDRISGLETSANISYIFTDKDARERSYRTSFQSDGSTLNTDGAYNGLGTDSKLGATIELKNKNRDKYMFYLSSDLIYTSRDRNENSISTTESAEEVLNSSDALATSHSNLLDFDTYLYFGIKNLGKERRSLNFDADFSCSKDTGSSTDYSETMLGSVQDIRNLFYDNSGSYMSGSGKLSYVEPFGDHWALQASLNAGFTLQNNDKAAFNGADGSANDYYSSLSRTTGGHFRERLLAQYEKDKFTATAGLQIDHRLNEQFTKSLGVENTTGEGEWLLNFAPYADIQWNMEGGYLGFYASGYTNTPSGASINPVLNISNPVQLSVGNIYLKTGYEQYNSLQFRKNNPKTFRTVSINIGGQVNTNGTVYASWFDEDGVRYAIPVNSKAPAYSIRSFLYYRTPLNSKKTVNLTLNGNITYTDNTSYQAKGRLPGLDKDNFDYGKTMEWFWGNASGDKFYSGQSGFAESRTSTFMYAFGPTLNCSLGDFVFNLGCQLSNSISRFSLDESANSNIWNNIVSGDVLWSGEKGWEIKTDARYNFYKGYSNGYGKPEFIWNFKLSKEVKSVTFSLTANDILNQRKTSYGQMRQTSAEYIQDSYYNTIGRYILIGISFNFGKMNSANQDKAREAMWQMLY